jgi:hypothetical protein
MSREELDREFDGELEKGLDAVKNRLASFHPPPLELDRDRVMFLAGQASLAGKASPPARLGAGWLWPGAFAGMTAVAATLLVILLGHSDREITGQPQVGKRPSDTVSRDARSGSGGGEPSLVHPDEERRAVAEPLPAIERSPAIAGLFGQVGSELSGKVRHDQLVRQIAEHGFDTWEPPVATSVGDEGHGAVHPSYGEWLELLRAEREFGRPVTEWKAFARKMGADS